MLLKRLMDDLREEKSKVENYVIKGQIQDFASYRFSVGQIKGLQGAIDICQNIFKGEADG
jgi:ABC-type xylose transport system substrate-binding protein